MGVENALKSSAALHPFVNRTAKDAPSSWRSGARVGRGGRQRDAAQPGAAMGVARVANAARSAALHACVRPPPAVASAAPRRAGVLWSVAARSCAPRNEQAKTVPGVLERLRAAGAAARAESAGAEGAFGGGSGAPASAPRRARAAHHGRDEPRAAERGGRRHALVPRPQGAALRCTSRRVEAAAAAGRGGASRCTRRRSRMDAARARDATLHGRGAAARRAGRRGDSSRTARRRRGSPRGADERAAAPVHADAHAQERAVQGAARRAHERGGDARDAARHGHGADAAGTICDFGLRVPTAVGASVGAGIPDHVPHRACRRARRPRRCTCASTARSARPR